MWMIKALHVVPVKTVVVLCKKIKKTYNTVEIIHKSQKVAKSIILTHKYMALHFPFVIISVFSKE